MTQSTRTSDNAGRRFDEAHRQLTVEPWRAPWSDDVLEALRIAARVSAEPDEATVRTCAKSIAHDSSAQTYVRYARAVIAAYRDSVLRGE